MALYPIYGIELLTKLVESATKNTRRSLNNKIALATTDKLIDAYSHSNDVRDKYIEQDEQNWEDDGTHKFRDDTN